MADTEYDSDTFKLFSNEFNLNVFIVLLMTKKNKVVKKLLNIKSLNHQYPQSKIFKNWEEEIRDYSNGPIKMGYTDCKKAHTQTLINPQCSS